MESDKMEVLIEGQQRLEERIQWYARFAGLALTLFALALAVMVALGWRIYSQSVGPRLEEVSTTMAEIHDMTAQTSALLEQAEQTLAEVRRTTGAIAPVVGQAQQTIQEAQETAQQVQAPLDLLRSIPVLNWFIQ